MSRIKTALAFLAALAWPLTKAKLHRLISYVGTAFAAFAVFEVWYASLGLSTGGKVGASLGLLATYATSWNAMRPRLDKVIDDLPIPDGATLTTTTEVKETTVLAMPGAQPAAPLVSTTPTPVTAPIKGKVA